MYRQNFKKNKGFTLIEILIVLSIIGIVVLLGVSSYGTVRRRVNLDIATNTAVALVNEARDKARVGYFESDGGSVCFGFKLQTNGFVEVFQTKYDRLQESKKCSRLEQDMKFLKKAENDESIITVKNIEKFGDEIDEILVYFTPPYGEVEIDDMHISSEAESVIKFLIGYNDSENDVDNKEIVFNVLTGNTYKQKYLNEENSQ
ncbi:type II secretion system GspH family protein [Patescibacteria group bacterium]|nr:type II secretion system GspH family protein [Patescibacteria group bacterium]